MKYEILTRSLKDSAAHSKLKLLKKGETFGVEKPGGEKRIHIGSMTDENKWDSFFFPNGGQSFNVIVSKIDLIKYMFEAKDEYFNPKQSYRLKISDYYDNLYEQTVNIPHESFKICFEKNTDNSRFYLSRPSNNEFSKNYNYIIDICLPIVTEYVFIRVKDDKSYIFYLKPEFRPNYITNETITPDVTEKDSDRKYPHQLIYFGTPGSGKSFIIKREYEMTKVGGEWIEDEEKKKRVIRTTFHPDTDYASFVGCYKPISYDVGNEKKIKYEFVPQAFTEAYVKAWNDLDSQYYLVLEEINRGNCAQIFGDLFQLLDRKSDGSSEYPIKADTDLRKYLEEAKDDNNNDILLNKEGIKDGKLCLPPNLYIIASMNTSDQSLFPMDSAFKRRWSWEYVPIDYNNNKSGLFTITIGTIPYLWHEFLKKINQKIKKVTSSEDKQMGNFFIKQSVDEKEFKDKVMFYLWSEVGKDNYQTKDAIFHCYKPGTTDEQEFSYNELYPFGTSKLQQFMSILGVEPLTTEELNEIEEESNESSGQKNFDKFSINGTGEYNKRTVAYEAVLLYVNNHPNETAQTIVDTWMALDFKVPNFIETSLTHEQRQLASKDKLFDERSRQLELPNGEVVYISKNYTLERIQDFIEKVNAQDWNIHIEKI